MPLLKRLRQQKKPLPQEVSPLGPSWPEVLMCRELTRDERKSIRKLVTEMCTNYDREYGCLPLDCECYMLDKCWTGRGWPGPGHPPVRYLRAALSPGGAANLLLRSLQGRGKPQKEPGAHEKKA